MQAPTTHDFTWWATVAEHVAKFVGGAAATWAVLTKLIIPSLRRASEVSHALAVLVQEVRPNGGTTMRDAVDRANTLLAKLSEGHDRIESRQAALEERWRIINMDTEHGIVECDNAGHLTWCNRTYREMTGLESEDLLGMGWVNAVAPEIRDVVVAEWAEAAKQERDWAGRVVYERPDGSRLCVRWRATRLDGGGYVSIGERCQQMRADEPCGECILGRRLVR